MLPPRAPSEVWTVSPLPLHLLISPAGPALSLPGEILNQSTPPCPTPLQFGAAKLFHCFTLSPASQRTLSTAAQTFCVRKGSRALQVAVALSPSQIIYPGQTDFRLPGGCMPSLSVINLSSIRFEILVAGSVGESSCGITCQSSA